MHRRRALLAGLLVALVATACLGASTLRTPASRDPAPVAVLPATAAAAPDAAAPDVAARDEAASPSIVPAAPPAAAPGSVAAGLALAGDEATDDAAPAGDAPELAYAGRDAERRPRYVRRAFTDEERRLLREAFGVSDPGRLWLPDSSAGAVLRYDGTDGVAARVGYRSWRRPGETWEEFRHRIERLPTREWPAAARGSYHTGLASLDSTARAPFAELVAAARAAGFRVRVAETYRAPERQAFILARGNGQTFTATSPHVYGRAADILVGDGRIDTPRKVREWIRFRRWVLDWGEGRFRLVGQAWRTWDWPHVELADEAIGFRTVDELLAAARRCLAAPRAGDQPADDPCALPRDRAARAAMLAAARSAAADPTGGAATQ